MLEEIRFEWKNKKDEEQREEKRKSKEMNRIETGKRRGMVEAEESEGNMSAGKETKRVNEC